MNFLCDNCQRRYSIADEKVRGKTVKVRCRNCNHLCTVQGPPAEDDRGAGLAARPNPAAGVGAVALASEAPASPSGKTPWDDEATVAAPPLSGKAEWFAMVRGKQVGPFDPRGLAELVRVNDVTLKSYVWRKGMAEWKRGSDVPELAPVFAGAPLPPGAAPAPTVAAPEPLKPKPAAAPAPGPQAPAASPAQPGRASSLADLPFDLERTQQPPTASQVGKVMNLGELFSDADLPSEAPAAAPGALDLSDEPTRAPLSAKAGVAGAKKKAKKKEEDPFAALGDYDPEQMPPPGEATRFFIAQAGVNKRNPWWKTVGFIVGGLAIVVGVLFGLGSMNVVPLKVTTTDASGKVVEQSVFSGEGVSALGDMLLGRGKKAPAEEHKAVAHKGPTPGSTEPKSAANMPKLAEVNPQTHVPTKEELAALYGDTSKHDLAPKMRKGVVERAKDTSSGALSPEQIARVVQQSQGAFQNCIEQELRKNPNLKVPRFYIRATVAPSGVVTATSIDRREVDGSNLGTCLKTRAKRMTFAHFAGDEVDIEIPLIVGTSM